MLLIYLAVVAVVEPAAATRTSSNLFFKCFAVTLNLVVKLCTVFEKLVKISCKFLHIDCLATY